MAIEILYSLQINSQTQRRLSIILIKFFLRNYAQVLKDYLQAMVQDVKESTGPLFRAATRHTLGEGKLIN